MTIYVADENLDRNLVLALRDLKFEVISIFESYRGVSDEVVIEIANRMDAVIITEDKDFGELTYRLGIENKGIVLIRLSGLANEEKIRIATEVIETYGDQLYNHFTVVHPQKIRIRKL
jgi:predicted nuclease of predicted toxin-antitoxin system